MSQWASAFAETGLGVSKTIGDLAGPCMFAVLMGLSRVFYAKFGNVVNLKNFMLISSLLCVFSYLLATFSPIPVFSLVGCAFCGMSVGITCPGTFSLSTSYLPMGGTAMFAIPACAGDIGCAGGPALVVFVSEMFGGEVNRGLLVAVIFPVILTVLIIFLIRRGKNRKVCEAW